MPILLKIGGTFAISILSILLIAAFSLQLTIKFLYKYSMRFGSALKVCAIAFCTSLLFTVPLALFSSHPLQPNHWLTIFNSILGFFIQAYIFTKCIRLPDRPSLTFLQALRINLVQLVILLGIILAIALVVGLILAIIPLITTALFRPS